VWQGELPPLDGVLALSFRDLIELLFVDAFLAQGVTWKTMRLVRQRAVELLGNQHPFSTQRFATDGHLVFASVDDVQSSSILMDIATKQHYFETILRPLLRRFEFGDRELSRWWPLGTERRVVLDPARSFGRPIVHTEGIPTQVLASALEASDDARMVCRWFEVSRTSLEDALEFERRSAA